MAAPTPVGSAADTNTDSEDQNVELTNDNGIPPPDGGHGDQEKDLEAQGHPKIEDNSSKAEKDPNLVTWDGPDDPENPRNWSTRKKWAATLTMSTFTFISPITSSMVAPALTTMAHDLGITNSFEPSMILSIFVLAYGVGPLFLGPSSEVFGRVRVLQVANLLFLAFNIGCGFAQTKEEILAFRFFAGLGGSAPMALGGGFLGDMFTAEERGKALALYTAGPLLGPALGPIAGGFIAEKTTWRWVFWSTAAYNGVVQLCGLFLLRESYAPLLLSRKASRLRKATGNQLYYAEHEKSHSSLVSIILHALKRPFKLLLTQPIIQALAVYQAYLYGVLYIVLSTYPLVWADVYHESLGIGGLNYISLGLGLTLGIQVAAPFVDRIYVRLKARNDGVGRPEFRVPLMLPASALTVAGIFIYGWTAQAHTHWIGPNIGILLFGAGTIISFQCNQTYVIDAYTRYAASAMSAVTVLRSCAGFGFPLFARAMYDTLGLGWGNSLLGFVAVGLGIPAPILFWRYGEALRKKSQFAAG